jgi:hypothetical protein
VAAEEVLGFEVVDEPIQSGRIDAGPQTAGLRFNDEGCRRRVGTIPQGNPTADAIVDDLLEAHSQPPGELREILGEIVVEGQRRANRALAPVKRGKRRLAS